MAIPQYTQANYGSYLQNTRISILNQNTSISSNQYSQKAMNTGTTRMKNYADKIPNKNAWTTIAKAAVYASAEFMSGMQQRRSLEANSSNAFYQAQQANLNAELAKLDKQNLDVATVVAQYDVYNQYRMGEIQAMEQGVEDAQKIASQRVQSASSGVQMDSGSKAELDQTNVLSAKINQYIIQKNTNSNAAQSRQQVYALMRQASDAQMQEANYRAQALIATGEGVAYNTMAKSIKPLENAFWGATDSILNTWGGGSSAGGKDWSQMFSFK